jgi:ABC-2 type transport system permease protein
MVLLVVTTIVTAMGLAREREVGTLEQVLVTPLRPTAILLGKLLPFLAIGLLDFGLAIGAGAWLFDVPLRGSFVLLTGATMLYVLCTLGMGLLISTLSASQQQAFMGGLLFMLPAVLLSGTLTPVDSMPGWLQPITYANPLRYYMELVRAAMLKGATARELWTQLAALGAFGIAIVSIAALRFRRQLA